MRNQRTQLFIGLAISALFLYWVLKPVEFSKLKDALLTFQWAWSVPILLLTAVSFYLRAVRWRLLLLPTRDMSSIRLLSPLLAGFGLNNLLPARAGEFARAIILNKKDNVPLAPMLGTIVVERLFDMITLLALLAIVFLGIQFDQSVQYPYSTKWSMTRETLLLTAAVVGIVVAALSGWLGGWASRRMKDPANAGWSLFGITLKQIRLGAIAVGVIAVAGGSLLLVLSKHLPAQLSFGSDFLISGETLQSLSMKLAGVCVIALMGSGFLLVPATRGFTLRMIEVLPYAPKAIRLKIRSVADSFVGGLESLRNPATVFQVLLQSAVIWIIIGITFQMTAWGFGMQMSFPQGQALNVIVCLSILIPAAPGYWGLLEVGMVFGLRILGIETNPNKALAYALVLHSIQYFPIVIGGVYCLWRERVSVSDMSAPVAKDAA